MASPLPVANDKSTIKIRAQGGGVSVVSWTGTYTPASGKEKDAMDALGVFK